MIARIKTGAKPAGAVLYNEDKVAHGEARFLDFVNGDVFLEPKIRVIDKINVLNAYARMNPRISKPTFHTSLAFHPSEQLSDEKLSEIGQQYMQRLGYGEQPYLVYRHEDTNHPHIHIVSVSVNADGRKVNQDFQKRRSNAIRQALEKEYGLIVAEQQRKTLLTDGLLPEQILVYKESEAKKAIGNVVQTAMNDYRFSGLETFSAFLHQYRVQLNQLNGVGVNDKPYRGITFQLSDGETDKRGQSLGPAIKASLFACAPTIHRLEQQFERGSQQSKAGQPATRKRIARALTDYDTISQNDFNAVLRSEDVQVLEVKDRFIYVDHRSRNVYDEDELGEMFKRERWQKAFVEQSKLRQQSEQSTIVTASAIAAPHVVASASLTPVTVAAPDVIPVLTTPSIGKKAKVKTNKKKETLLPKTTPIGGPKESDDTSRKVDRLVPLQPAITPVQSVEVSAPITTEQKNALMKAVSEAYQKLRKKWASADTPANQISIDPVRPNDLPNVSERQNNGPFYFESQLIARFPYQQLTEMLTAQGIAVGDAREAITNFERYKQSHLPEIRAKEQSYFEQTTALLLKLVQKMPISAISRQAFLRSMELDLVGFNIRHRQDGALYYPLSFTQQNELRSKQGNDVPFADKADNSTRSLYIAIASEQPVPLSVSYYQIDGYQLRKSVEEQSFMQVAPSLNLNYISQVERYLDSSKPILIQLASRGIVVEKEVGGSYRAGHILGGIETFVDLNKNLAARLSPESIPSLSVQQQSQQTAGVRSLVQLSQAIDLQDESRTQQVSRSIKKQFAQESGVTNMNPTQIYQLLLDYLKALYKQPLPAVTVQTPTPIKTAAVTPAKSSLPERSAYGQAVIAMLLKAELSPVERGLLASELGLEWQVSPSGRLQVTEKTTQPALAIPHPGAVYELDGTARSLIELPKSGEPVAERKSSENVYVPNEEDRLVLVHQLAERPMHELRLSNCQVARLQINGIKLLTKGSQQPALQSWYNAARGHQIISQRPAQNQVETSARRYLTDLYQRGFVVQRSVTSQGQPAGNKPHYSMGSADTPFATFAALPDWLSQRMEQVSAPIEHGEKSTPTVLIEGGWCDLSSREHEWVKRLARVLDSEQPAGITAAVKFIQQNYPALRQITDSSILLDALASQTSTRLQQHNSLLLNAAGPYKLEAALDEAGIERGAQLRRSFAEVGSLSVVKTARALKPGINQTSPRPKPRQS